MGKMSFEDVCALVAIIKKLEKEDAEILLSIIIQILESKDSK